MSTVVLQGDFAKPLPTPVSLMTAETFCELYENRRAELVKGIVKEVPMPWLEHGKICATWARLLGNYAHERQSAHVMTNDSFIPTRRDPDTVRGMDVCYITYEKLQKGRIPGGMIDVVPELIVEVKSPSETWNQALIKMTEYISVGVMVVIIVDAGTTTASVYRENAFQQIYHADQVLTIPDVLPGFSVRVGSLFE